MLLCLLDIQFLLIIEFDYILVLLSDLTIIINEVSCERSWMKSFEELHGREISRIFDTLSIRNLII